MPTPDKIEPMTDMTFHTQPLIGGAAIIYNGEIIAAVHNIHFLGLFKTSGEMLKKLMEMHDDPDLLLGLDTLKEEIYNLTMRAQGLQP